MTDNRSSLLPVKGLAMLVPASLVVLLLSGPTLPRAAEPPPTAPQYNRDIRPILAESCFACHGPDKNARKAKLRLDVREDAIKAGAIVPGKPSESELVTRINATDPSEAMPPAKSHKTLTPAQKKILEGWIAAGAEYQPHWAFIPPTRPALPPVKNAGWVRNPIDRFILADLEKRGLSPSPEADRRTLARRLSLDLTGLPPTPEDVETFVKDTAPEAYERYVDKLLASPHWGEHRGRYWLDAARYADTHGIHFDNYREIWTYRDWVIRAFNENKHFDQFVIEQLAGDLVPNRTLEQQVATGFNRCNMTTNEGGAISEEYLVLYNRDRTETVGQVFLGLTAGCAVCHDHKFDPLSQKEFYQLAAFFNNTAQNAMDGNIKDTPPIINVPREEDRARFAAIGTEITNATAKLEERKKTVQAPFEKWLKTATAATLKDKLPTTGLKLHAPLSEGKGDTLTFQVDGKPRQIKVGAPVWKPGHVTEKAFEFKNGSNVTLNDVGDFDRDQTFTVAAWVKIPARLETGAILSRMDDQAGFRGWDLWNEGHRIGIHLISKWQDDALKVLTAAPIPRDEWTHICVSYDGSGKAAGVKIYVNGLLQANNNVQADSLKGTTRTKEPFRLAQRTTNSRSNTLGLEDVRLYNRALPQNEAMQLGKLGRTVYLLGKKRTPAETSELLGVWLATEDQDYRAAQAALDKLKAEETAIRARGTIAYVSAEKPGKPIAYILTRGDYDKRSKDPVDADTPAVLPKMKEGLPHNRLGFAQWLVQPNHPLTARVTVNRFWQEVFGTGIVRTTGDFGMTGEAPTHPELLDWLAVEFRETDWDVKRFFKLLVTSATYRQSAAVTPEKREKDPSNILLSRGPRFRMDGEMIRDYALSASGLLTKKLGGPSVRPYQPEGVWEAVAMRESNTHDYKMDSGESLYRRSMYTLWKRAAPPASMDILNAPSREVCTVRRERTNTPLQALVTLNDPQFVEAARVLATAALKNGGTTTDSKIDFLAKRILARSFTESELPIVKHVLDGLQTRYKNEATEAKKLVSVGQTKADESLPPADLAAWTMLVNTLMNLDEVLNK
jgi:Protein of unknown function (DUF1553)/Protein of unknown function (DUF1549)/Concanavalin A-like lectin/glucanases superfamily/Planctomycete cytochrome C